MEHCNFVFPSLFLSLQVLVPMAAGLLLWSSFCFACKMERVIGKEEKVEIHREVFYGCQFFYGMWNRLGN
jgi:hypothetical protein